MFDDVRRVPEEHNNDNYKWMSIEMLSLSTEPKIVIAFLTTGSWGRI